MHTLAVLFIMSPSQWFGKQSTVYVCSLIVPCTHIAFPLYTSLLNAGQFWNVPVKVSNYEVPPSATPGHRQTIKQHTPYMVTVAYPGADTTRSFAVYLYHRTWDQTASLCLYAGNSQGGPWSELPGQNDSIIEGSYKDYITRDLFDVNFVFSRFKGGC